jgi:hypothetical protein
MSRAMKLWWAWPLAIVLVLAGCKVNSINYFPPHPANVRVVNVLPDVGPVNVQIDGNPAYTAVAPQTATGYQSYENKVTTITVTVPGSTTNLLQFTYSLAGEQTYTLVLSGAANAPVATLLQETTSDNGGNLQVNIANTAVTASVVDVYVTAPGADITTMNPNFGGLAYNGNSLIQTLPAGVYQVRVTPSGSKGIIYDSGPQSFAATGALTILIYSRGSGDLVTAAFLQSQGSVSFVDGNTTRLKVVNAAAATGNVDQLLGTTVVASNIAYGTASGYNEIPPGAQAINFQATTTPGAVIASTTATLVPSADQSVFITGTPGASQAYVLADMNVPPKNGNVRVRFVNTSTDAGPLDVLVNGAVQFPGVALPTASPYLEIVGGTYALTFNSSTTALPVLALPAVVLTSGQVITVYVTGPANQLTGLVTQDD